MYSLSSLFALGAQAPPGSSGFRTCGVRVQGTGSLPLSRAAGQLRMGEIYAVVGLSVMGSGSSLLAPFLSTTVDVKQCQPLQPIPPCILPWQTAMVPKLMVASLLWSTSTLPRAVLALPKTFIISLLYEFSPSQSSALHLFVNVRCQMVQPALTTLLGCAP